MNADYYRDLLAKHGPTYQAVDAGSEESHIRRLRILTLIIPNWSSTILDVGCGVGHLITYGMMIERAGYRGIDILPEMITAARVAHPRWCFEVGDITKPQDKWVADYVLASGLFQFQPHDRIMKIMFELCRKGVACNFLRTGAIEETCSQPEDILGAALLLTPYVSLRADYLPNDFTIFLSKEQSWP